MSRHGLTPTFALDLPVLHRRAEIASLIERHRVVILCGETGSGKTTQLPQICLSLGRGRRGAIAHTQPRRIAARAVAARIAEELSTPLGPRGGVGYKVRFDDQSGPANAITVMTDGSLLTETQRDRDLRAYDTIIVDEAHERSLNIDFLLGYLKQLLERRDDLKVIVTSATIDPDRFSRHFGGPSIAPVIEVSGRTFPVEIRYRPPRPDSDDDYDRVENDAIVDVVAELCRPGMPEGGILVFLPGEREIRAAAEALRREGPTGAEILPLYSRLSAGEQQRIFREGQGRRIILATNVAETSLTVPGIRFVIDTGLARISRYDHAAKVRTLPVDRISRASAEQRSGRCGRVAAGVCIRLFSEADFQARDRFTQPEVLRTSLASVILQGLSLRLGPVEEFPFIEPPSRAMIKDGYETLYELEAIDLPGAGGTLTEIGRELARLPLDPRIGRMVLASRSEGCTAEVLALAAGLSIQDPRERPMSASQRADDAHARFRNESSDFLTLLNIFETARETLRSRGMGGLRELCREAFLSFSRLQEWLDTHHQLAALAREMGLRDDHPPAHTDKIHRALLTGLVSNLCCKDESTGHEYVGPRGARVSIFPGSVLFRKSPRWFVAAEIVETTRLYARTLAKVDPNWVVELAPHAVKRSVADAHFDDAERHAVGWERLTVNGVVVTARKRVPLAPIDPRDARRLLIEKGLVTGALAPDSPFARHNRELLQAARRVEGKLRRRDVLASPEELARFFEVRLPEDVVDGRAFDRFVLDDTNAKSLFMQPADVLNAAAAKEAAPERFPDVLEIGNDPAHLSYLLRSGHDDDGVTLTLSLVQLGAFDPSRADWLVPGMLAEKMHWLLKTLPKQVRARLEASGPLTELASQCASLVTFGEGSLLSALTEAIEVLRSIPIAPDEWAVNALPDYLLLNLRVVDDHGQIVAEDRDAAGLRERLAGRIERVSAARARAAFASQGASAGGFTSWTFGDLPQPIADEHGLVPALVDGGSCVTLTLLESKETAERATQRAVLRLFALAAAEDLVPRMDALPNIEDLRRLHKPLGSDADLRSILIDRTVERTFLMAQPLPRTKDAFDGLLASQWGRLGQHAIETAALLARILEPRAKVAHRLGGGTPRTWAVSVADIREHAAYLLPAGFLRSVPAERLREYPRYIEGLRHRLFVNLREDGSTGETKPLHEVAGPWKTFTAFVAQRLSQQRQVDRESGAAAESPAPAINRGKSGQPLPAARRAAPSVNVDAGAWALVEGNLPPEVAAYRWMLEDFRLTLFAPALAGGRIVTAAQLSEAWAKATRAGERPR
ncbi:MAG: ATP-dependent RNA helicase HrpA [Phycisphaerales bacterium]